MGRKHKDLTGQRYGRLTPQNITANRTSSGGVNWACLCDCGRLTTVAGSNLIRGHVKSCGCLGRESLKMPVTFSGQVFGRLVVLNPVLKTRKCLCRCECGKEKEFFIGDLRSGRSKSCGCNRRLFSDSVERDIFAAYNSGIPVADLAKQYGCSKPKIYKVVSQQKKTSS